MVLLSSFQNSVKPKTQHDCGWWNSAMCYRKKKKAKLRQSCSLVCGYCPSGRWPQPCVRPGWMHAVGFYPAPGSTYVLGRRHVLPQFTEPPYRLFCETSTWEGQTCAQLLVQPLVNYFSFSQSCCSYQYFKGHYPTHIQRIVKSNTGLAYGSAPQVTCSKALDVTLFQPPYSFLQAGASCLCEKTRSCACPIEKLHLFDTWWFTHPHVEVHMQMTHSVRKKNHLGYQSPLIFSRAGKLLSYAKQVDGRLSCYCLCDTSSNWHRTGPWQFCKLDNNNKKTTFKMTEVLAEEIVMLHDDLAVVEDNKWF